jgi:hypothetical protein
MTKINLIKFFNFEVRQKINGKSFKIPFNGSKMGTENLLLMEKREVTQHYNQFIGDI